MQSIDMQTYKQTTVTLNAQRRGNYSINIGTRNYFMPTNAYAVLGYNNVRNIIQP